MTNKERAFNILNYKQVDRLPAVHFGYWNELLLEWAEQGHISMEMAKGWRDGNAVEIELDKMLGWDFGWYKCESGNIRLKPYFDYKELEISAEGFITYINHEGLIEQKRKGAGSIPSEIDYLLKDRQSFEELYKPKMHFSMDRIPENYFKNKFNQNSVDYPRGLHLGSVLGEVRNMLSMVGMSYIICDDYELFAEIIDLYADMQFKCAEATLRTGAKFDYAHYWEDICFKNGPLISPIMFEELCAKHYQKRNDLVKSYGIEIISLDCDGVTDRLLPIWFNSGVNTMFPIEIGTWGDQFEPARKKFGKGILGIGGMDKTAFRKDKAAIDEEIKRLTNLVNLGGFIPCPDHRLMPGTKWELVKFYVKKIKEISYKG